LLRKREVIYQLLGGLPGVQVKQLGGEVDGIFMLGSLSEWNGQHTMPWRSGSMPYIFPTCRTVMADLIF